MSVLKLRLYQETVSYTKPFAFKVGETYPLPPYSTVLGLLHRVLQAKEYHEMAISIQGTYGSKFQDYRTTYFYKKKNVTTMPINIHYLYDIELVIHVDANKELLEILYERLQSPCEFYSLGRREDLVQIREVKWVGLKKTDELITTTNDMYIPTQMIENEDHLNFQQIKYQLNTRYHLVGEQRVWDRVEAWYVSEGTFLDIDTCVIDEDEDAVFFHLAYNLTS